MEVVFYSRSGCELSSRIRDLLEAKGVAFREHECVDGHSETDDVACTVTITRLPMAVVDGVAIPRNRRADIGKAIGWLGC